MTEPTNDEKAGRRIEAILPPDSKYGQTVGAQSRLLALLRTFTNDEARTQLGHALGSLHRAGVLEGIWRPMEAAASDPSEARAPFKDGDAVWFTCSADGEAEYAASVKGREYGWKGRSPRCPRA